MLLTGMSGTGKSALVRVLHESGYAAVDLDSDHWSHWVDCDGNPTDAQPGKDWQWREDAVQALLQDQAVDLLLVGVCAANMGRLLPLVDHVVLPSAPPALLVERVGGRVENHYGKSPEEVAAILSSRAEVEPLLRKTVHHEIDTSAPLQEVLARLLGAVDASALRAMP